MLKKLNKILNDKKRIAILKSGFVNKFTLRLFILSVLSIFLAISIKFIYQNMNVAKVNGKYISKLDFYNELQTKYGSMVVDDLITKSIIFQEAKKNGVVISSSDINNEISIIQKSVEDQGTTLDEVLKYQGMTYNQLVENIKIQKILEELLKNDISVTDQEIQSRYDENKDIYGHDKTFEDVKEDIRYQIYQEKITSAYQTWIQDKRNASSIQIYLKNL